MGLFSFLFGNSGDDWFDTGRTETRDEGTADVKYSIQRNSRTGETRLFIEMTIVIILGHNVLKKN